METRKHHSKLALIIVFMAFIGLVLIGVAEFLVWNSAVSKNTLSGAEKDSYQAVFLNNGQVYFGKLQNSDNEYLKLSDVWYLRATETSGTDSSKIQDSTNTSTNATIIKLGNEIHGPKDEMLIAKDQVLFYENLKDDGKVVKAIKADAQ
jgi:hypothetical protein